jgi:hypothetical protein
VGGATITVDELDRTAAVFRSVFDAQQKPCGTSAGPDEPPEAACNRFALGVLIQFEVAESYATAHHISANDKDVKDTTDRFVANFSGDALTTAMKNDGVTRADLEEVVRRSLIQDQVATAIAVDAVGEDGLRQRYDQNMGDYTIVQVDHIISNTKAEAEKIYLQVTAPGFTVEDFKALATKVSIDPSVSQNSGALGSAYASSYAPAFRDAVLALTPGEISRPVKTPFGWHVIWMVAEQVTPYSQARTQILSSLKGSSFATYVQEQAAGTDPIEVDPRFGRFDPATLAVVAIRSTDPSAGGSPAPVNATPGG